MINKILISNDGVEDVYLKRVYKWKLIMIALIVSLIVVILLSANIGFTGIPPLKVLKIFIKGLPAINHLTTFSDITEVEETIVIQIRMPRILAGVLVGAALSTA
ncbi:MAG: iron chelate uptake ABC transporter family permease subunit, partial [Candidatus Heimdallarchaeota archaeon]